MITDLGLNTATVTIDGVAYTASRNAGKVWTIVDQDGTAAPALVSKRILELVARMHRVMLIHEVAAGVRGASFTAVEPGQPLPDQPWEGYTT